MEDDEDTALMLNYGYSLRGCDTPAFKSRRFPPSFCMCACTAVYLHILSTGIEQIATGSVTNKFSTSKYKLDLLRSTVLQLQI